MKLGLYRALGTPPKSVRPICAVRIVVNKYWLNKQTNTCLQHLTTRACVTNYVTASITTNKNVPASFKGRIRAYVRCRTFSFVNKTIPSTQWNTSCSTCLHELSNHIVKCARFMTFWHDMHRQNLARNGLRTASTFSMQILMLMPICEQKMRVFSA